MHTRRTACDPQRGPNTIQFSTVVWRGRRDGSGGGAFMYSTMRTCSQVGPGPRVDGVSGRALGWESFKEMRCVRDRFLAPW